MIIKLDTKNTIFTFRNETGELSSINLADYSGKINFRKMVKRYLKEEDIFVTTRPVERGSSQFLLSMTRSLTAIDILKIALRLQGGTG